MDEVKLALEMNKLVHNECKDVPHDIGLRLLEVVKRHVGEQLNLPHVSGSLLYSEREIDFAYLAGVFNVSGIDGLQKEIERLKGLGKNPHDIIIVAREQ